MPPFAVATLGKLHNEVPVSDPEQAYLLLNAKDANYIPPGGHPPFSDTDMNKHVLLMRSFGSFQVGFRSSSSGLQRIWGVGLQFRAGGFGTLTFAVCTKQGCHRIHFREGCRSQPRYDALLVCCAASYARGPRRQRFGVHVVLSL